VMFKHAMTPTRHYGVEGDGIALKVFSTRFKADDLLRNVQEAKRLLRRGAIPRYAFPPHIDTNSLADFAKCDNLRVIELIAEGSPVTANDIAAENWTRKPNWSLRSV
jgi:hypothetical protein